MGGGRDAVAGIDASVGSEQVAVTVDVVWFTVSVDVDRTEERSRFASGAGAADGDGLGDPCLRGRDGPGLGCEVSDVGVNTVGVHQKDAFGAGGRPAADVVVVAEEPAGS